MVKAKWAVSFPAEARVLVTEGGRVAEGEPVAEVEGRLVAEKKLDLTNSGIKEVDQSDIVKSKKLVSPVAGKIGKIEKERVVIEFRAEEFLGKEICGGKTWGECDFKTKNNLADLGASDEGKVVLVSRLDGVVTLKAETIGVKGILIPENGLENDEMANFSLPILMLSLKDWERLLLYTKKGPMKVWLSSAKSKLLVVI